MYSTQSSTSRHRQAGRQGDRKGAEVLTGTALLYPCLECPEGWTVGGYYGYTSTRRSSQLIVIAVAETVSSGGRSRIVTG